MELNREQITKALECCPVGDCDICPYKIYERGTLDGSCADILNKDALALIKELTNDVADLKAIAEQYQKQFEDCYEENERLHATCTELTQNLHEVKSDIVRKMQERINARFYSDSDYLRNSHGYIRSVVDQIAKEMLKERE